MTTLKYIFGTSVDFDNVHLTDLRCYTMDSEGNFRILAPILTSVRGSGGKQVVWTDQRLFQVITGKRKFHVLFEDELKTLGYNDLYTVCYPSGELEEGIKDSTIDYYKKALEVLPVDQTTMFAQPKYYWFIKDAGLPKVQVNPTDKEVMRVYAGIPENQITKAFAECPDEIAIRQQNSWLVPLGCLKRGGLVGCRQCDLKLMQDSVYSIPLQTLQLQAWKESWPCKFLQEGSFNTWQDESKITSPDGIQKTTSLMGSLMKGLMG